MPAPRPIRARARRRPHAPIVRPQIIRMLAAVGAAALVATSVGLAPWLPVAPAAAVPGVPDAPVVLYAEDFEGAPDTGPAGSISTYVSTSPTYLNGTYTAATYWMSRNNCNGLLVSSGNTYQTGDCFSLEAAFNLARALADPLGTIGGTSPTTNTAVSAYTAGNSTNNQIMFATTAQIPLSTPSRYLTFSVDAAATSCHSTHPRLQFYARSSTGVETALGTVIDPCDLADPRTTYNLNSVRGGTYPASGSILASGPSVGIVLRNIPGTGSGNDGAFDNIRLLDATPQLDKSFGTPHPLTGVSTLTFTVTNSGDLATKLGWSAVDTLSPGMVVAPTPNAATTCAGGVVTATAGGSTVAIGGNLSGTGAQLTSCTITVDVVPSTPTAQGAAAQVFQNCASNLSNVVGLNPPTACASVSFPAAARLAVTKASSASTATREGDVVTYAVTVTNTGGAPYTVGVPATVTDDLSAVLDDAAYNRDATATSGAVSYTAPTLTWSGPLAVGASVTITYSVTATLAGDAVLGNSACVPNAQASGRPCADVSTTITRAPSLSLVKSASPSEPAAFLVGQVIAYTFVVTNTGNVVIANPTVAELSFNGSGGSPTISCPPTASLAPGAQLVCTASYALTQTDIDDRSLASRMINTAEATGSYGATPVVSAPSSTSLPAVSAPALAVDKSVGPGVFTEAGQVVTYAYLVTNTGNVTLSVIAIVEDAFTGSGAAPVAACPSGGLLPGAQVTCVATYTLTQADVDAGGVDNTAHATAQPPSGGSVSSPTDTASVDVVADPALALTASAAPGPYTAAGQIVPYTFTITNTGNVTVSGVAVTGTAFTGSGTLPAPSCTPTTLAPTAVATCTASYALTQADVDAQTVSATAEARGTAAAGGSTASTPATTVVAPAPVPGLSVTKSLDRSAVAGAGAVVEYAFRVVNTGGSTVSGIAISEDAFTGSGALATPSCPVTTLAPGGSTVCTADYTVTSGDAAVAVVDNTASATGTAAGGVALSSAVSSVQLVVDPTLAALAATGSAVSAVFVVLAIALLIGGVVLVTRRPAARRR